jgi:alpha-galactosidase
VIIAFAERRLPSIIYWGEDLGELTPTELSSIVDVSTPPLASNLIDEQPWLGILPEPSIGWMGTPGLSGSRDGRAWTTRFVVTSGVQSSREEVDELVIIAEDRDAQLALDLTLELRATGLLRARATVTNHGADSYQLDDLHLAFPVPHRASELLDLAGRWTKERVPQRTGFLVGQHVREQRQGRTGCDGSLVTIAGTPQFGFNHGEVWGIHLGWSGNHRIIAERTLTSEKTLAAGELLWPGEVQLSTGENYTTPWLYGSYSPDGLDSLSARFHGHLRERPDYPTSPRPVTINVWEAVYFDHDFDRLVQLADQAAALGVERYVLDDGWFGDRRNDHAGLGDWQVSEEVWPGGSLNRLSKHVRDLGMQFGIWFEPEMINMDSDTARNHPDWVLKPEGRLPIEGRFQQVLDLSHPEAFAYLLEAMTNVIEEHSVEYIKWDHNRMLLETGSQVTKQASVRQQTLALYRLIDELRERFPRLEVETCSSGGGRIDLEILDRTDRVWASDCIDARERQEIQRWTSLLIPLELLGSHVGDGKAHTTGRMHELDFRAGTALFGHFGIEWDLAKAEEQELQSLGGWIEVYKAKRSLLHSGRIVRSDESEQGTHLHGVVSHDQAEGIFAFVVMERPVSWPVGTVRIPGLSPNKTYRVEVIKPLAPHDSARQAPLWWTQGVVTSGKVLGTVGLQAPALFPETLVVFQITEVAHV